MLTLRIGICASSRHRINWEITAKATKRSTRLARQAGINAKRPERRKDEAQGCSAAGVAVVGIEDG